MKTKNKFTVVGSSLLAVSSCLFAHSAMAVESNSWTIGANLGGSYYDADYSTCKNAMVNSGLSSSCTYGSPGLASKLSIGYQFTPQFALETSYLNFGRLEVRGRSSSPTNQTVDGFVKAEGFAFSAIVSLPINNSWSVLGKLGFIQASTTASPELTHIGSGVTVSTLTPTFGIGAQMNLTRNFGLRMEWDRYQNLGDKQKTFTENVDQTSFGVLYYFK